MRNLYYVGDIYRVGGTTSHIYNLARKYCDEIDLVVLYRNADLEQLERLERYVKCIKVENGKTYECEKAFFNYDISPIDQIEAKEYIQVEHANYKYQNLKPHLHDKITRCIGVSQIVCDTFKEVSGRDTELCYNPFVKDKPKRVLKLMTACRMNDKVKGKDRMYKFARMLEQANIPYIWLIFCNDKKDIENPNIVFMPNQINITDWYGWADYYVGMSETEGYSYSYREALSYGTPLIVVDIPVLKELGVNKTNGFILDLYLEKVPLQEIYEAHKTFTYQDRQDHYLDYFAKGKSEYRKERKRWKRKRF